MNAICKTLLSDNFNRATLFYCQRFTQVWCHISMSQAAQKHRNDDGNESKEDNEPPVKVQKPSENRNKNETQNEMLCGQRRRKFGILMGYCGAGYYGMQRQPGNPTIEEALLEALLKAKLIAGDVLAAPGLNARFQRAARTDKGVSAACQLVSMQIAESIDGDKEPASLLKAINEHLPEQIRVHNLYRVTKAFDAKQFCCGRTYCYMLPTYAFKDCSEIIQPDTDNYRIDKERLTKINEFLQHYKGTHSFHNFTSGLSAEDKSATRYMMNLECSEPFVVSEGDKQMEFVTISIKGQSFMLHQIRKMIALLICVIRGNCSIDTLGKAWGPDRVDIPMAPPLGLYLNRLHFDNYNRRFGKEGQGTHEPLDWVGLDDRIDDFKKKYIEGHIVKTEITENTMLSWLATLSRHSFDYSRVQGPNEVAEDSEPPPETNEGIAAKLIEDKQKKDLVAQNQTA